MSIFENYLNNPQTAEWFLNLFFRSICIISIGWGIIILTRKQKAPFIERISLVVIIMLIAVPAIPIISGIINNYGITTMNNQIELEQEYILVISDNGLIEKQEKQLLNIIKIINISGLFWILIFLLKILLILYKLLYIYKFRKGLKIIKTEELNSSISKTFGIKNQSKIPDIYLSSIVHSPVALGLLKPIIVIPEKIYNKLEDQELKSIVFHEMSHIARYDHISGLLQQIILSFYWWNPFIYKISREYSIASEYICDNFAIKATSPKLYANTLISLIEKTQILNRMPGLTGISSPHIDLKERIKKIIQKERKMDTKLKNYLSILIIIGAILAFGLLSGQSFIFAWDGSDSTTEKIMEAETAQKLETPQKPEKNAKKLIYRGLFTVDDSVNRAVYSYDGKVYSKKVISGGPLFRKASIEPNKKWKYEEFEPLIQKEEKYNNTVKGNDSSEKIQKISIKDAKRIKYVAPKYPIEALKTGSEGVVVVEVIIGINGKVSKHKVIRGHPLLNEAAIKAIKQWEYIPFKKDGKIIPVSFYVTINFSGGKRNQKRSQAKRIKYVAPIFPEDAKKNKLSSIVILEATTDTEGKVVKYKIISGHPIFNQAAIDAVKQWVYEPYIVNGKKKGVTFTVTVNFTNTKKE